MRLRITAPDGGTSEREVTAGTVRLGRDPACEVPFDQDAFPMVSGRHARIALTASGYVLTPLSQSNKTLLNNQPVESSVPVKAGDRIRLGVTGPTIEVVADIVPTKPPSAARVPPPSPNFSATAQAG